MGRKKIIILPNHTAYLPGVSAAVTFSTQALISNPDGEPIPLPFLKENGYRGVVPWGKKNNLPAEIIQQSEKSPIVSAGLPFNISMTYGEGLVYGHYKIEKNRKVFVEMHDNKEINEFLENNDICNFLLEQTNDANWFGNMFPEIILNRKNKIVVILHKEAMFSRLEEMNPKTGIIENHFYSADWSDPKADNVKVTPMLSPYNTVADLQERMGIIPGKDGIKKIPRDYNFIIPLNIPTPGRSYYQKPSWYSIFASGWFDYSLKIPEFKNALMDNQMTIKYHVELSDDYFTKIFTAEGINDEEKQQSRIKKEYEDLNNFLTKTKNTGKSVISFIRYNSDGKEMRRMKITVIKNELQGGEYLEDSEEASNILSYAMNVHPSLIGASPGKNKTISGSEARELFIIKQAQMRPIRDRLLRPFYIIKRFNGWPDDIHFAIPNLVLTTLDKGTGSEKVIS